MNYGQAAFTRPVLMFYDWFVLGLTCNLVWRCPNERVLAAYRAHLSGNHLEVGVGTGFFLDRCDFPVPDPRLALLDLNSNCLARTARRVARYRPEIHQANILAPLPLEGPRFDSIGLNYVLHCLPGGFPEKAVAFGHLAKLLNPGGILFGSTVLCGTGRGALARAFLRVLNARRVFSNTGDDAAGLSSALKQHFRDVQVEIVGCVALFSGRA